MKLTTDTLESGMLPTWAEAQAARLSKLRTFQPNGWTAVGSSRVYKKLTAELRAVGITGQWMWTIAQDICDMARLKAGAK